VESTRPISAPAFLCASTRFSRMGSDPGTAVFAAFREPDGISSVAYCRPRNLMWWGLTPGSDPTGTRRLPAREDRARGGEDHFGCGLQTAALRQVRLAAAAAAELTRQRTDDLVALHRHIRRARRDSQRG
jgi:hypothetical protein